MRNAWFEYIQAETIIPRYKPAIGLMAFEKVLSNFIFLQCRKCLFYFLKSKCYKKKSNKLKYHLGKQVNT